MANTKFQFACVLLLLFLILHQQDLYVQGRHLRSGLCRGCSKTSENMRNLAAYGGGDHGSSGSTDHDMHQQESRRYQVDDFRPTSPGHSPGVGHSINN